MEEFKKAGRLRLPHSVHHAGGIQHRVDLVDQLLDIEGDFDGLWDVAGLGARLSGLAIPAASSRRPRICARQARRVLCSVFASMAPSPFGTTHASRAHEVEPNLSNLVAQLPAVRSSLGTDGTNTVKIMAGPIPMVEETVVAH